MSKNNTNFTLACCKKVWKSPYFFYFIFETFPKCLKDAYEKEKKIYENCIMFREQCLYGKSFLRRDNDEVPLQSPRVVKEEYVEYKTYVKNEKVKSEPDQSKFKKKPLVAYKKSEKQDEKDQ